MERVGEYQLTKVLASGGQGDTYLAKHDDTGDVVVIKRCRTGGDREARNFANMSRHHNVVALRTSFAGLGGYCIVMDYVKGDSLEDVLENRGALHVEDWWPYFKQILLGTDHIHRHHLVHQDLKPANIIMSRERPVIVDLGGARGIGGSETVYWTHGYEAPEVHSLLHPIGTYSDIYSLAVIFSEVVLGGPVPNRSVAERADLRRRLGEAFGVFGEGIARGLMDEADKRPQTVSEWLAELATPSGLDTTSRRDAPDSTGSGTGDMDRMRSLVKGSAPVPKSSTAQPPAVPNTTTLAALRDRVAADFELPTRSVAFLSPDAERVPFNTQVGTWCRAWTGHNDLEEPSEALPGGRFVTKKVRSLRAKVENVYGLPTGSTEVLKPDGSPYGGNAQVRTVRADHKT